MLGLYRLKKIQQNLRYFTAYKISDERLIDIKFNLARAVLLSTELDPLTKEIEEFQFFFFCFILEFCQTADFSSLTLFCFDMCRCPANFFQISVCVEKRHRKEEMV